MIEFRPDYGKALEAILWLSSARPGIDIYRLLKILFLADKEHLNRYGRPIVNQRYVAMVYGPVAETSYDILRRKPRALAALGVDTLPIRLKVDGRGKPIFVFPERQPNMRRFSKSDLKLLSECLDRYGEMHFGALKALTHEHRAYKNAWAKRGTKGSIAMNFEDFLNTENQDEETVAALEYISRYA